MDNNSNNASRKSSWKLLPIIKYLQRVSEIFGISVPNLYNYKGLPLIYVIYGVFLCILQLIFLTAVTYIRTNNTFSKSTKSSKILTMIIYIQLTFTNILGIICHIFIKRRKLVKMVKALERIESILQDRFQEKINYRCDTIYKQTVIFISIIVLINIYDCVVTCFTLDFDVLQILGYCSHYLQILLVSLLTFQIHLYCTRIKTLFKFTHANMRKCINPNVGSTVHGLDLMTTVKLDVLFFLRKYDELCDIIDAVSDIYGLQILSIVCCVTLNILQSSNLLLKVLMNIKKTELEVPAWVFTIVFNGVEYVVSMVVLTSVFTNHYFNFFCCSWIFRCL